MMSDELKEKKKTLLTLTKAFAGVQGPHGVWIYYGDKRRPAASLMVGRCFNKRAPWASKTD